MSYWAESLEGFKVGYPGIGYFEVRPPEDASEQFRTYSTSDEVPEIALGFVIRDDTAVVVFQDSPFGGFIRETTLDRNCDFFCSTRNDALPGQIDFFNALEWPILPPLSEDRTVFVVRDALTAVDINAEATRLDAAWSIPLADLGERAERIDAAIAPEGLFVLTDTSADPIVGEAAARLSLIDPASGAIFGQKDIFSSEPGLAAAPSYLDVEVLTTGQIATAVGLTQAGMEDGPVSLQIDIHAPDLSVVETRVLDLPDNVLPTAALEGLDGGGYAV